MSREVESKVEMVTETRTEKVVMELMKVSSKMEVSLKVEMVMESVMRRDPEQEE